MPNRDPCDGHRAGWSSKRIVAAIITVVLLTGIFLYAMTTRSSHTGGGPAASASDPGTTGQR